MYLRDLSNLIKLLEGTLKRVTMTEVNKMVIVNLCRMYVMACVNNGDVKVEEFIYLSIKVN